MRYSRADFLKNKLDLYVWLGDLGTGEKTIFRKFVSYFRGFRGGNLFERMLSLRLK